MTEPEQRESSVGPVLPVLPEDARTPRDWAQGVPRKAPHGLDLLEAHVFAYATQANNLAHTSTKQTVWSLVLLFGSMFASIGGFAAWFGNPESIRRGWMEVPGMSALPWGSICYWVAVGGVIGVGVYWLLEWRIRHNGLQFVLFWSLVFAVLGLPVAYNIAADAGETVGTAVIAPYLVLGLSLLLLIVIQCSPKPGPEHDEVRVTVDELDERGMKYLMSERKDAIKIYVSRNYAPGFTAKELHARPLGRLHIDENAHDHDDDDHGDADDAAGTR